MKKELLSFISFIVFCFFSIAQVPQAFNYQAVVRDDSGNIIENQDVGIKISLLQGSIDGTVIYSETHTPITNSFGLIILEVGYGTVVSGDLSTVD